MRRHTLDYVLYYVVAWPPLIVVVGDTVLVGTTSSSSALRWAKSVPIGGVDRATVHGHIFALTDDGLCPYELQDGPLPDLSGVGDGFLADFIPYLTENNLVSLIGLQVLGYENTSMLELVLDQGTVMLKSGSAKNVVPTRITGWKFESIHGNPRVCAQNETHAAKTSGNHQVFNAGKPLPKLENVDDLKLALIEAGLM
ncbi:hypothetical protein MBLNU459_g5533t2 [Dothideomycetes sp. NU459]